MALCRDCHTPIPCHCHLAAQGAPVTVQPLDLDAIETRAAHLDEYALLTDEPLQTDLDQLTGTDVPAMAQEIRRLRAELAAAERIRENADFHLGQEMGRRQLAEKETARLAAALEQIRHLHKDSPMGPCPLCIDADAVAAGGDGLVPYPCPTARLAGAQDCDPPHVRIARYTAAGDEMAASLARDGFGDDEIADMLHRPPAGR